MHLGSSTTAAATTGPAQGPRPASSMPHTCRVPLRMAFSSIVKSGPIPPCPSLSMTGAKRKPLPVAGEGCKLVQVRAERRGVVVDEAVYLVLRPVHGIVVQGGVGAFRIDDGLGQSLVGDDPARRRAAAS